MRGGVASPRTLPRKRPDTSASARWPKAKGAAARITARVATAKPPIFQPLTIRRPVLALKSVKARQHPSARA